MVFHGHQLYLDNDLSHDAIILYILRLDNDTSMGMPNSCKKKEIILIILFVFAYGFLILSNR
jgi:hypothetical protein